MNLVDIALVVLAVVAGLAGWRQGLIGGVLSFTGFIVGALAGAALAPMLLSSFSGWLAAALGIAIVLVAAGIGNALAGLLGRAMRERVTWKPARVIDSVGGSMFGVLSMALIAWVVASALVDAPLGPVSNAVRSSRVLGEIDAVLPQAPRDWVGGLRSALDSTGFPQAFAGFTLDPVIPVAPPDETVVREPAIRAASSSIVRVEGDAPGCDTHVTGSGFVYAVDRVMTNAHVVAGVSDPVVIVRGKGREWPARVVFFDPQLDGAVLDVPGLSAPELHFSGDATRGDPVVVAGYPGGGALTETPARIRARINARGTDIYGRGTVTREIFSLRGVVRSGDSGGPLLGMDGRVEGVIFASSVQDPDTGYALTASTVSDAALHGVQASASVGTGTCSTH